MKSEQNTWKHLPTLITFGISLFTLDALSKFAFCGSVAKEIKDEANGICKTCNREVGYNNLVASHMWHGTKKDKKHGKAQCKRCEAETHISHQQNPQAINLNSIDNDTISWGHFKSLSIEDRQYLLALYPNEIANLQQKYYR